MMGEVVYGIDFRQRRNREFQEAQAKVIKAIIDLIEEGMNPDTAPSEYCAPENDPA